MYPTGELKNIFFSHRVWFMQTTWSVNASKWHHNTAEIQPVIHKNMNLFLNVRANAGFCSSKCKRGHAAKQSCRA